MMGVSVVTGYFDYKNFRMLQHENISEVFFKFIQVNKPEKILEIGTYDGGLIVLLKDIVNTLGISTKIVTYDIAERDSYSYIRDLGIDVRTENLFTSDYNDLVETSRNKIISFIQSPGVTLVLCDGGNKINEFNILANYIKPGDFILAHDYAESLEYFAEYMNKKIWNWCEITEYDIRDVCKLNELKDYMKKEFQSVAWVCKQK